MNRISKLALTASIALCCSTYASIPNYHNGSTPFLGPTLRMSTTSYLTDVTAYSVAGELGVKDLRGSVTFGWAIADYQRVKITAELLSQELTYSFVTNNNDQWVYQGAIGGDYVYDLNWAYHMGLDLNAYYSYASSKSLGTNKAFFRKQGVRYRILERQRIAGSDAFGINPGVNIEPWDGTRITALLNYDHVSYNTKYGTDYNNPNGFGGTISLNQLLTEDLGVNLLAAVRRPFNDYEVELYYKNMQYLGRWTVGLFGNYIDGKASLPNSWNMGLSADFDFDPCVSVPAPANMKGERDYKGEMPYNEVRVPSPFVTWVGDPAVRMPQVLAIPDSRVSIDPVIHGCPNGVPTVIAALPNDLSGIPAYPTINQYPTAQAFSGKNLGYSVTFSGGNPGDHVSISRTGVVTVEPLNEVGQILTINVTARNTCGAATTSFIVVVAGVI